MDQYPKIYEQFYRSQNKKGTITQAYVQKNTGEIIESTLFASYIYHDTNRVLPLMHRSDNYIPSSHYTLSYCINPAANYLEFNFSIPKFLYGTNVIQFLNIHDQSSHVIYLELMNFISKFLRENLIHTPLFTDVEIHRLDLCYNQIFNCKNDALQYLDEQKNLLTKFARSSKNNYRSYDTSLMYITRRYSFKIYHKGTEFKKKDYPHLVKNNPKGLPLQYLCDQADNILRYEMTFRKSMINYLVQHYFNISKKQNNYTQYADHSYSRFCKKLAVTLNAKAFDSYVKKQKSFTLQSCFDTKETDENIRFSNCVTFDETIFTLMFDAFRAKIKQYQLDTVLSVDSVVNKIRQHNESNKLKNEFRRVSKADFTSFRFIASAMLIQRGVKLDEFKQYIPERTLYRLKAQLKEVGISNQSSCLAIPAPRLDYLDYKIYFKQFH